MTKRFLSCILAVWLTRTLVAGATPVPDDFPRFEVPGQEAKMTSLRALFWLHYQPAQPLIPLWDAWMPMSTLWPARDTNEPSMSARWAATLAGRPMDAEGYVLTQQHDGPAHAEGWPFPRWMEAGGIGWHFRGTGVPGYDAPPATPQGWQLNGGQGGDISDKGWPLALTQPGATLQLPAFTLEAKVAPWLRLNWWATGLAGANCYLEWTTRDQPEFGPDRRAYFAPADSGAPASGQGTKVNTSGAEIRTMIPVYRLPGWKGTITGLRLHFDNPGPAAVVIKSFHTACDTRQTINNATFIQGCHDYFVWSGDIGFLRSQIGRLRTALHYLMSEFQTRQHHCMYTTWPGHDGRSGVQIGSDGKKRIISGQGIGGNYWDLLPFGGEDALATVYYYAAVLDLAELEAAITRHPEWCIARGAEAFGPVDLRQHAQQVKEYGTRRFWNETTGRFGTVDLDGQMHDYGFTFLNNEAIYYDFATPEQARSIRSWISGQRQVAGDTAQGADIYHWRFGPRSTTRRNVDYYVWCWSAPESIPWGYQVQDGGAVLGFSYHDLMARLKVAGPDDAWQRLKEILVWFDETQAAGGYREYYKDPARGTMQGGNVPGGLGLDKEFFESILLPQVMIYGFLGLQPTPEGLRLEPRLPKEWPALTITRIHLHRQVVDITVRAPTVTVRPSTGFAPSAGAEPLALELPPGWALTNTPAQVVKPR